eukprot:s128_g21.t3
MVACDRADPFGSRYRAVEYAARRQPSVVKAFEELCTDGLEAQERLAFNMFLWTCLEQAAAVSRATEKSEDIAMALARWQSNCQQLPVPRASGIYKFHSFLQHSCAPNCAVGVLFSTGEVLVRALRTISAGEVLTRNYEREGFLQLTLSERRQHMQKLRGFTCLCGRCLQDAEVEEPKREIRGKTSRLILSLPFQSFFHQRCVVGARNGDLLAMESPATGEALNQEPREQSYRNGVWKRNEKLVYLSNFLHMTLYTMCFGGIFDIFLYHLSQDQQVILEDRITVGGAGLPPIFEVNTYSNFELTFSIRPFEAVSYPSTSNCSSLYTCGTSILHITDGTGNGDCCQVGNRIPFAYFANGTTKLQISMDALGQNETLDRRSYDKLQHCSAPKELPLHQWTNIKLKASGVENSKGQIEHSDGGMIMFINEEKVCEVPGTAYHTLPSRNAAMLFLGSLQSPPLRLQDQHLPAKVEIQSPCRALRFVLISLHQATNFIGISRMTDGEVIARATTRKITNPMAPTVRLTYFEGYGLAEQIRWMLAATETSFEQVALQTNEEFLQMRRDGKLIYGQLPLLEIDGLKLVQSQAMVRYVAQRGKLWGTSPEESVLVDMIAEGIKDARGIVLSFPFSVEQENLVAEIPMRTEKQLGPLESMIHSDEDGTLGFLLSGLSAADILLAELAEELTEMSPGALSGYPKISRLHKQVTALPQIRAYLEGPKRYPFPRGEVGRVYVQNVNTVRRTRLNAAAAASADGGKRGYVVKYGKPASNLFVGLANSAQGILSMLLMYPIGWIGDKTNRYYLLRWNVLVAAISGVAMLAAVYTSNLLWLFIGICIFTWYQQTISSTIYACLADNVIGERRTRAGVNYKTFSALAMSFGPAIQLCVVFWGPKEQDAWSSSTFELLLLPGWLLLPMIGVAVTMMVPVGKELSEIPNTDDAHQCPRSPVRAKISEAWLEQSVCFSLKRRFVVAVSVNVFFIATLLANGMTVRYFSLYFTQVLRFSPAQLCMLNAVCRLFIAAFAQLGKPLSVLLGRCNLALVLHIGSAIATLGIYGGGFFNPSVLCACACYLLRFACLHARDPVLYSITMDCVPQSQRSRWAALNSLRTLSFSASAVLGGFLADRHGYQFSFTVTIILLLACTLFMLPAILWFPRKEGLEQAQVRRWPRRDRCESVLT